MSLRYAGIIKNDIAAAPGICVSFFTQGCPFRCKGCHNPETWDFKGGKKFTDKTISEVIEALDANGIDRTLCIMGGEPLCKENLPVTATLIEEVIKVRPKTEIFIWTGFTLEELNIIEAEEEVEESLRFILQHIDCLIDGRYEEDKRDITLSMRGSSNQRIFFFDKRNFL